MPFPVVEGIILEHKILVAGLEVDQAKVSTIETLMLPTAIEGIRSFLGHAGFHRRFIKDFSKISRPLCRLLEKDSKFDFDESCRSTFEEIKSRLVIAPIMETPDWNKDFEIMCDAMQWEQCWDKEQRKFSEQYTMPAKPLMKHKIITQLQKRRCWQWCFLVKSLGHIYEDPKLSYTLIM